MGVLYCIIGKSCSGKDTVLNALLSNEEFKIKPIIPYTTRPIRKREKNGVDYVFVSVEEFKGLKEQGKVIESREYDTVNGKWYYFTVDKNIDIENESYVIITTLEAIPKFRKYYGEEKVVPIYLEIDGYLRLKRAVKRENRQKKPNAPEICRRFLADEKDFSEENLTKNSIDIRVDTSKSVDECVRNIIAKMR